MPTPSLDRLADEGIERQIRALRGNIEVDEFATRGESRGVGRTADGCRRTQESAAHQQGDDARDAPPARRWPRPAHYRTGLCSIAHLLEVIPIRKRLVAG